MELIEYRDILVFEDALPQDLCDEILRETKDKPQLWSVSEQTGIWHPTEKVFIHAKNENVEHAFLSKNPELKHLDQKLIPYISAICSEYNRYYISEGGRTYITEDSGYEVIHYPPGASCAPHTDGPAAKGDACRIGTLICFLNDVARGGSLVFRRQHYSVKPKKGRAVIYPPGNTHVHEVTAPLTDRFVLVSFLSSRTIHGAGSLR